MIRQPKNVLARVEPMPFFNPARKTAPVAGTADGSPPAGSGGSSGSAKEVA